MSTTTSKVVTGPGSQGVCAQELNACQPDSPASVVVSICPSCQGAMFDAVCSECQTQEAAAPEWSDLMPKEGMEMYLRRVECERALDRRRESRRDRDKIQARQMQRRRQHHTQRKANKLVRSVNGNIDACCSSSVTHHWAHRDDLNPNTGSVVYSNDKRKEHMTGDELMKLYEQAAVMVPEDREKRRRFLDTFKPDPKLIQAIHDVGGMVGGVKVAPNEPHRPLQVKRMLKRIPTFKPKKPATPVPTPPIEEPPGEDDPEPELLPPEPEMDAKSCAPPVEVLSGHVLSSEQLDHFITNYMYGDARSKVTETDVCALKYKWHFGMKTKKWRPIPVDERCVVDQMVKMVEKDIEIVRVSYTGVLPNWHRFGIPRLLCFCRFGINPFSVLSMLAFSFTTYLGIWIVLGALGLALWSPFYLALVGTSAVGLFRQARTYLGTSRVFWGSCKTTYVPQLVSCVLRECCAEVSSHTAANEIPFTNYYLHASCINVPAKFEVTWKSATLKAIRAVFECEQGFQADAQGAEELPSIYPDSLGGMPSFFQLASGILGEGQANGFISSCASQLASAGSASRRVIGNCMHGAIGIANQGCQIGKNLKMATNSLGRNVGTNAAKISDVWTTGTMSGVTDQSQLTETTLKPVEKVLRNALEVKQNINALNRNLMRYAPIQRFGCGIVSQLVQAGFHLRNGCRALVITKHANVNCGLLTRATGELLHLKRLLVLLRGSLNSSLISVSNTPDGSTLDVMLLKHGVVELSRRLKMSAISFGMLLSTFQSANDRGSSRRFATSPVKKSGLRLQIGRPWKSTLNVQSWRPSNSLSTGTSSLQPTPEQKLTHFSAPLVASTGSMAVAACQPASKPLE